VIAGAFEWARALLLSASTPANLSTFESRRSKFEALNQEVRDEKSNFDVFPGGCRWRVGPGRSRPGRSGATGSAGVAVRASPGSGAEVV
jgi:hypothetical protein